MQAPTKDSEMKILFDRFMETFVEGRDPRIDLDIYALKQLKGPYLEKAKTAILERLEKGPDSDALSTARAIDLTEAIPILQTWLHKVRSNPDPAFQDGPTVLQAQVAFALYGFTKDIGYIPDVVTWVKNEGYGEAEFTRGVSMLTALPLTVEGIAAVWERYKKGKRIKYPYSWMEICRSFFQQKIHEPLMKDFLNSLPSEERAELFGLISETNSPSNNHRIRLANREKEEEHTMPGDAPCKGLTLKYIWKGHTDSIGILEWSRNVNFLLSSPHPVLSKDIAIRIWSLDSGSEFKILQRKGESRQTLYRPRAATWLGTTQKLVILYEYGGYQDLTSAVIWDMEANKLTPPVYERNDTKLIKDFICFPDGQKLLMNFWYQDELLLIDIGTKSKKQFLSNYTGRYETTALSANGKAIAFGYHELKDSETGIKYSPGLIYGKGIAPEVLIYDVGLKKVVRRINTGHLRTSSSLCINRLCWMPNQPILAVAAADNTISVWNVQTGERIILLEGHFGSVMDLSFSADGKLLASKSDEDRTLRIWRTDTWKTIARLREPNVSGRTLAFHPSQPILASLSNYGASIRIWEFDYTNFFLNPPIEETFS